jgi:hypothetical protein
VAKTQQDKDKAVCALVTALKNKAMKVRHDAAEALRRIGDARAMKPTNIMRIQRNQGWCLFPWTNEGSENPCAAFLPE